MNNKLKLALVYTDLSMGGIQRKIVDIVSYIYKKKLHTSIDPYIFLKWHTKFSFKSELPATFQQLHYTPRPLYPLSRRNIPFISYLFWVYLVHDFDVILTHVWGSTIRTFIVFKLLFWKKPKIVISQDNIFTFENPLWYERWLAKIFYPSAEAIIVQTQISKQNLIDYLKIPAKKIIVIPNWATPRQIKPSLKEYDLIYCGRFVPQKNLKRLLRVVKSVKVAIPKVRLLLIGSGSEEAMLKKLVKQFGLKGNVIFHKPVSNVYDYFEKTKCFVLTSRFEGQPMALVEAMNAGLVPVCLHYPGVAEYISHGKTGFILKNEAEMTNTLIKILKNFDNMKDFRKRIQTEVQKKYGEGNIQAYLKVLQSGLFTK